MNYSVAKGLIELKLLDSRITRNINDGIFISHKRGSDLPKGYKTVEEIETKLKANNQSVRDLINQRNKIKSSIVTSNATTSVEIAGVTMTVAEAIERKNSIVYEKQLLNIYKAQLASNLRSVDQLNTNTEQRADEIAKSYLSGSNDKARADEADTMRKNYVEQHKAALIDTLDIKSVIEKLEDEIEQFEADVDLVLSTSNAITQINI